MTRIVLAYSGGPGSSLAIRWLAEKYGAEVVTVTVDLGQGTGLDAVRSRALGIGAVRAHVIDARDEFARGFIWPALAANAIGLGGDSLATALGRPLIAKHLVSIARIEDATTVAHACAGNGDDHHRLERSIRALDASLAVIAPAREWGFTARQKLRYAEERGLPVSLFAEEPCSVDVNLWGRTIEGDDRADEGDQHFVLTRRRADAPDQPASVEIAFERGLPVATNGVAMSPAELIASLETIAGTHGVGRIEVVRPPFARQIGEAPAAVVLNAAHTELQRVSLGSELDRLATDLGSTYADLVHSGLWYTPAREAIDAFMAKAQERVSGEVRLRLSKGQCHVVASAAAGVTVISGTERVETAAVGKE